MDKLSTFRQAIQLKSRRELLDHQLTLLNELLAKILPTNQFYESKIGHFQNPLGALESLSDFPFTRKAELVDDGGSDFACNLTYPVDDYVRMHRTSGTRGRPLIVLDTAGDWEWWMESWQYVLDSAHLTSSDRVVLAFSFGPFIGFWSAFDSAHFRGALTAPAGGMNTMSRLELIQTLDATVIFCTPSYAIHMADVAAENQLPVGEGNVRSIIVAGEPGGNVASIRDKIEAAWNAEVIDHAGASEIGPWGFADERRLGLYVNEADFIAEFISIETGQVANENELSELVITTLGRPGSPVIRYRTGDLVRPSWNHQGASNFVLLLGGVLGRVDDMMIIRGVNVFPSSIEQILRSFPEIVEYRMTAFKQGAMDQVKIEIEDQLNNAERVSEELQLRLGLRIEVSLAPSNSLPRFELKGKRFIDNRNQ